MKSIDARLTKLEARPEAAKPFKVVYEDPETGGLYDKPFYFPDRKEYTPTDLEGYTVGRICYVKDWRPTGQRRGTTGHGERWAVSVTGGCKVLTL